MTQNLTQDLIDLSNRSLGAHSTAELHFNHGENRFGVRPFVVMLQESFPIVIIEMPHAMPQSVKRLSSLTAFGVAFEWYEWNGINGVNSMEITSAGVCLVRRYFADSECLGSGLYQFGKLRSIGGFCRSSFYAGDDMSLDTAHQMGFYPLYFASHLSVFMVKPSVIYGRSKARGINGEIGFYCSERTGTLLNKSFEQWCQFRILKVAENASERWRLSNQFLCFCFSDIGHKASAGHCAVCFEHEAENNIGQWQAWSAESIFRLLYSVAQVTEQRYKPFLFMGLDFIIDRPVLGISYPHRFGNDFRAVWSFLFPLYKLDGVDVLALFVCSLKVLAGAKRLAVVEVHHVSSVAGLGRHFPAQFVLFNRVAIRYCQSSFLPFFHFLTPYCIYNSIHCIPLSIPLGLILGKIVDNLWITHIDNGLHRVVLLYIMANAEVQAKLVELKEKGWTFASIGRALDLSSVTIEAWNAGTRSPANPQPVLDSLDRLLERKRIPKKKIYAKTTK